MNNKVAFYAILSFLAGFNLYDLCWKLNLNGSIQNSIYYVGMYLGLTILAVGMILESNGLQRLVYTSTLFLFVPRMILHIHASTLPESEYWTYTDNTTLNLIQNVVILLFIGYALWGYSLKHGKYM